MTYPLPETPESWGLNHVFMGMLNRAQSLWAKRGYAWKFGIEMEFSPVAFTSLARDIERIGSLDQVAHNPGFRIVTAQYEQSKINPPDPDHPRRVADDIRAHLADPANGRKLRRRYGMEPADMVAEMDRIIATLDDADDKTRETGIKNVFAAMLYTRTRAEGGLADILEPRFGDYGYGLGWWDGKNNLELRTKILGDPIRTIRDYHTFLKTVHDTAPQFGLGTAMDNLPPQIHYSIWRKSDGKNMMLMDDEDSIRFCDDVATGFTALLVECPSLVHDFDPDDFSYKYDASIGTSRFNSIRQLSDNWEWRRGNSQSIGHMARDLAVLMGGSVREFLTEDEVGEFNHAMWLDEDATAGNDYTAGFTLPKTLTTHPVVAHKFGVRQSGIQSTLEHCKIGENGALTVPYNIVEGNIKRLQQEVNEANLKLFKVRRKTYLSGRKQFDLSSAEAWHTMFKTLKLGDDNKLDTSKLHPELRAAFDTVEITGRRTALNMPDLNLPFTPDELRQHLPYMQYHRGVQALLTPMDVMTMQGFYEGRIHKNIREAGKIMAGKLCAKFTCAAAYSRYVENHPELPQDMKDQDKPVNVRDRLYERIEEDLFKPIYNEMADAVDKIIKMRHLADDDLSVHDRHFMKTCDNMVKLIRPHFLAAVQDMLAAERARERGSNLLISQLAECAEFIERDMLTVAAHEDYVLADPFDRMMSRMGNSKKFDSITEFSLIIFPAVRMSALIGVLSQQPEIESADILKMLEESKPRILQKIDAIIEKNAELIKSNITARNLSVKYRGAVEQEYDAQIRHVKKFILFEDQNPIDEYNAQKNKGGTPAAPAP